MSTNQVSQKQNLENDRIIEQWMKKNKSGQFIVQSNKIKEMNNQNKTQNERRSLPAFSFATRRDHQMRSATKVNITPNNTLKVVSIKRNSTQAELVAKKKARWSPTPKASPIVSIKLEPANKTVVTTPVVQQSNPNPKPANAVKQIPTFLQTSNSLTNKLPVQSIQNKTSANKAVAVQSNQNKISANKSPVQIIQNKTSANKPVVVQSCQNKISANKSPVLSSLNIISAKKIPVKYIAVQSNQNKTTNQPTKKVIIRAVGKIQPVKNGNSHKAVIKKKNTNFKNTHLKLKDNQDVYSSVQDNYKNLYMPDNWSSTEFAESDSNQQCIVFSKPCVVKENDTLVTVMQKSLIIDKGGTMHYSVHGLPVDGTGTILPNVLDNVKKLLSIVHIFDKMQVCKGLGDDLLIVKTDNLIKDVCQVWRHVSCKLLLVKADQCQACLDTRNVLLEKEMLFKSEVLSADCMNHFMAIKEEHD